MKFDEALDIIEQHNRWRLSSDIFEGIEFDTLTEAFDVVIAECKKINKPDKSELKEINIQKMSLFDSWWQAYNKKVGREVVLKKWVKLSFDEINICLNVVHDYVASTPDKKFRKDPSTYLNQKSYYDEIILPNKPVNGKSISEVGEGVLNRILSKNSGQNDNSADVGTTDECDFIIVK